MKRLFTTTALVASMALASAAYAASDDPVTAPDSATQQETQRGLTQDTTDSSDDLTTGSLAESDDVLTVNGDAAVLSPAAISARTIIGATVVGPNGDEVGTVNDLVLSDDQSIEQIIVTDGGILGYGGKDVAIGFEGATITRDEDDNRTVRISMTEAALDEVAEFDKAPLEEAGNRLGSSYLDREVNLASADDRSGELQDLIMDESGAAKYAVIDFGGMLEMDNTQVAVKMDTLTPAGADEPLNLAMTEDQLRQAPKFHYENEDVNEQDNM